MSLPLSVYMARKGKAFIYFYNESSRGDEVVDVGLMSCNAMWTSRYIRTSLRNILPLSSAFSMFLLNIGIYTHVNTALQPKDHYRMWLIKEIVGRIEIWHGLSCFSVTIIHTMHTKYYIN